MLGKIQSFFASLLADQRRRKRVLWLAVGLVVAAVFAFDSMPTQQVVSSTKRAPSMHFTNQSSVSKVSGGEIWVAISGAVKHQGVYRLHPGDRVFSLVFMAGGFLRGAAQESVNLARTLVDGEQVIVAMTQSSDGGGQSGAMASSSSTATTSLPINRATASELEALPGIGPTLAQRIAQYRDKHGPFKSKADLLNVPGIGPKLVAGFADSIAY